MSDENPLLKSRSATVLDEHTPPDAVPLTLHAGDRVVVGDPHPSRAGYVWVDEGDFSGGWVPNDVLAREQSSCHAIADYCSAELAVSAGDRVRLMWEDPGHGAWWCESADSERGWVWTANLQFD